MSSGLIFLFGYDVKNEKGVGVPRKESFFKVCEKLSVECNEQMNNGDQRKVQKSDYSIAIMKNYDFIFMCLFGSKSKIRIAFSLVTACAEDPEFKFTSGYLRDKFNYYNDPSNDGIESAKTKVNQIKSIMGKNIDNLLSNLSELEEIQQLAEELKESAHDFKRKGGQVKRKEITNTTLIAIIAILVLVAILVTIIVLLLGATGILSLVIGIVVEKLSEDE